MTDMDWNEDRRVVYENPHQKIWRVVAEVDRRTKEYFITDYGPRAGLVVVRDQNVLLVRQYRLLINRLSWEIPGGKVDDGETPERAAIRECLEETGIRAMNPILLLHYHPGLDTLHNPTSIYLSSESYDSELIQIHAGEVDGHAWVRISDALNMMATGEIIDSFSLLGLFSFNHWLANQG